jgi:uncharacterized protein (DUF486 family)
MATAVSTTIILLVLSNLFMTAAWYGHLKYPNKPLVVVILVSWLIAFFEYCLQVPANRIGNAANMSKYQLKIIQEVVSIGVFMVFALAYFGEYPRWNHYVALALIIGAVYFGAMPAPAVQ